ncbi:NAD(P)H-binding protein [Pseudomonadota bacterium]
MKNAPILIIGKNGKTGARVDQRLQHLGYATRPVSRSTSPSFDWEDPTTWAAAMTGVRSAYVTYQPDLAMPRAEATIKQFVQAAREHGIEHIVLLSGRGEDGAQRAERALQESGISWNIVRCSWFSQNFSENFMLEGVLAGEVILPAADTLEPFVDTDDIADVAVATLTDSKHRNKLYELTGPRAINFAQCIEELSEALGRPIKYTPVPIDSYIAALREQGQPEDLQWLIRELFTVIFDGRNSQVMHGIEEALGRPATDFKTYIQKTIATGVWDESPHKVSA